MQCEPRWGDSLAADAVPEWRDHPTPLALRAIDPPPPGEGKKVGKKYLNPRFPHLGTSPSPRLNFALHPRITLRCTMLTC